MGCNCSKNQEILPKPKIQTNHKKKSLENEIIKKDQFINFKKDKINEENNSNENQQKINKNENYYENKQNEYIKDPCNHEKENLNKPNENIQIPNEKKEEIEFIKNKKKMTESENYSNYNFPINNSLSLLPNM